MFGIVSETIIKIPRGLGSPYRGYICLCIWVIGYFLFVCASEIISSWACLHQAACALGKPFIRKAGTSIGAIELPCSVPVVLAGCPMACSLPCGLTDQPAPLPPFGQASFVKRQRGYPGEQHMNSMKLAIPLHFIS